MNPMGNARRTRVVFRFNRGWIAIVTVQQVLRGLPRDNVSAALAGSSAK